MLEQKNLENIIKWVLPGKWTLDSITGVNNILWRYANIIPAANVLDITRGPGEHDIRV